MKILVVDDAKFIHVTIGAYLKGSEFEIVGTAQNGLDALSLIKPLKPDIITLDITMPGVNGLDLLGLLRKEITIPIIIISALSDASTALKALELGAKSFLLKPFTKEKLLSSLRKIEVGIA